MNGTNWEAGLLHRDFQLHRTPEVVVFFQEGFLREAGDGSLTIEKGKGTGYYEDLLAFADVPPLWRRFEDLMESVSNHAKLY